MSQNPSKNNYKVLFAISNIEVGGGAEKVATTVANQFLKEGIDLKLLTFYTSINEHSFDGHRISMHEATPASLLGKIPRALKRIWIVKKVCKENDVDIIFSFLEESNYYVLLSKLLLRNKTRMIVSVRNDPNQYPWIYKLLIKILYPYAEKVVSVTRGIELILAEQYGLTKTTTIYNPVRYDLVKNHITEQLPKDCEWIRERSSIFVTIGRLARQKGQWHMIRSFVHVVNSKPEAVLIIIGTGPYKDELESLIKRLNLTDNVYLVGKQKNVYPFLAIADVFLLTSLWEGLPNVILEALASGCNIISTDTSSGAREILAPELPLKTTIVYPHYASKGILVRPFLSTGDIKSLITSESEKNEIELAEVCVRLLENTEAVNDIREDDRFVVSAIIEKWKSLI